MRKRDRETVLKGRMKNLKKIKARKEKEWGERG